MGANNSGPGPQTPPCRHVAHPRPQPPPTLPHGDEACAPPPDSGDERPPAPHLQGPPPRPQWGLLARHPAGGRRPPAHGSGRQSPRGGGRGGYSARQPPPLPTFSLETCPPAFPRPGGKGGGGGGGKGARGGTRRSWGHFEPLPPLLTGAENQAWGRGAGLGQRQLCLPATAGAGCALTGAAQGFFGPGVGGSLAPGMQATAGSDVGHRPLQPSHHPQRPKGRPLPARGGGGLHPHRRGASIPAPPYPRL